jgi:hypothetical protein
MAADLEFDTDVRRRIYEYVEQHGAVPYGEVRDAVRVEDDGSASKPTRSGAAPTVPLTPQAFADHVEALLDAGHLREEDGKLRVGVEAAPEPFELDDGTPATVRLAREADREGVLSVMDEVAAEGTSIVAETIAEVLDDDPLFRRSRHHSRVCFVATVGEAREEDETEAEVRAGDEGETEDQAPASEDTADADHGERGGEVLEHLVRTLKQVNDAGSTILLTIDPRHFEGVDNSPLTTGADIRLECIKERVGGDVNRYIVPKKFARASGPVGDVIAFRVEPGAGFIVEIKAVA